MNNRDYVKELVSIFMEQGFDKKKALDKVEECIAVNQIANRRLFMSSKISKKLFICNDVISNSQLHYISALKDKNFNSKKYRREKNTSLNGSKK